VVGAFWYCVACVPEADAEAGQDAAELWLVGRKPWALPTPLFL